MCPPAPRAIAAACVVESVITAPEALASVFVTNESVPVTEADRSPVPVAVITAVSAALFVKRK